MLGRDNVKEPEPWNSDIFHSATDQSSCIVAVRSPAEVSQNMIKMGTTATDQAWQKPAPLRQVVQKLHIKLACFRCVP